MNTAKVVGTRRIEIERANRLEVIDLQVKVYAAQMHRPKPFGSGSGLAQTIPIWVVEAQEADKGQRNLCVGHFFALSAPKVRLMRGVVWTMMCCVGAWSDFITRSNKA
jgi:hypothetical protein